MPHVHLPPRFYFHIQNSDRSFDDRIGEYHADPAGAHERAVQLAKDLRRQADFGGFNISIVAEDGSVVARVPVGLMDAGEIDTRNAA